MLNIDIFNYFRSCFKIYNLINIILQTINSLKCRKVTSNPFLLNYKYPSIKFIENAQNIFICSLFLPFYTNSNLRTQNELKQTFLMDKLRKESITNFILQSQFNSILDTDNNRGVAFRLQKQWKMLNHLFWKQINDFESSYWFFILTEICIHH